MSGSFDLRPRHFESRIADLGFDVTLPHDWVSHELPEDNADFSDTTRMIALAAVMAPHSMIVFAVAARPAYEDGTLSDWARFLLEQNGLEPRSFGEHRLGPLPALIGEAVQESDLGPMHVRFLFAEDGQRLLNVTLSAPEVLANVVTPVWFTALESFALTSPRGPTVALWPPVEVPVVAAPVDDNTAEEETRTVAETPTRVETETQTQTQTQTGARARTEAKEQARAVDARLSTDDMASAGLAEVDGPVWWKKAVALERADQLEAAEQTIRDAVPHIGMAITTASLYRDRMTRLASAGDEAGALVAREQARHWAIHYASLATSGGEGAALSLERDAFLATLG